MFKALLLTQENKTTTATLTDLDDTALPPRGKLDDDPHGRIGVRRLGQGRGAALRYRLRQDQRQRNGEQEQHRAAPGSARALGGGLGIMGRHR